MERILAYNESSAREAMAARVWKDVATISERNDIVELKSAVNSFRKNFGDTRYCAASQAEIQKITRTVDELVMDGLAGYWKFDEDSGTTALDSSGKGNNGALLGEPEINNDVPDIGTANRHCLSFDGKKALVKAALPLTAVDNWSLAAWINPAVLPQTETLVVYVGDDSGGYGISVNGNGIFVLYGAIAWINSTHALTANTWTHVAAVRSDGILSIYVNGVPTAKFDKPPKSPANYFEIAHQPGAQNRYYQGKIDDVRVYDRALTTDEVQTLAHVKKAAP
jgi:hypothetical protein